MFLRGELSRKTKAGRLQRIARMDLWAFAFCDATNYIESLIVRVVKPGKVLIGAPGFVLHPGAGLAIVVLAELPALQGTGKDVRLCRAFVSTDHVTQRMPIASLLRDCVLQWIAFEAGGGAHHEGELAHRAIPESIDAVV